MAAVTTGMVASAEPSELLASDDREAWADLRDHPVWKSIVSGDADKQLVSDLVIALAPVFTGRARYMLAAKVSWLDLEDGKAVFADIHRSLTIEDADADAGWDRLAIALGINPEELAASRYSPLPTAVDLVTIVREHSLRSAHEAVGVAWVLDRRLPELFGDLADALSAHYGVSEDSLSFLRYRQREEDQVRVRVEDLASKYLVDPWETFVARRAGREVSWGLVALLEEVAES
jgi:pyrroloquinoline quinone (PQQ) biosynthesis protein C